VLQSITGHFGEVSPVTVFASKHSMLRPVFCNSLKEPSILSVNSISHQPLHYKTEVTSSHIKDLSF
jgi:hypothetical protein